MVEISNNKKNIIILFIIMIIILFFIYKGFIADSSQYIEEYKKYLISINASKYYFKKIDKNKDNNKSIKDKESEKPKELFLKIEDLIKKSFNINNKIINDLNNINYTEQNNINITLYNTISSLIDINKNNELVNKIISSYFKNNSN